MQHASRSLSGVLFGAPETVKRSWQRCLPLLQKNSGVRLFHKGDFLVVDVSDMEWLVAVSVESQV